MNTTSRSDDAFLNSDLTPLAGQTMPDDRSAPMAMTIAAAFATRERAHDAVHQLHDEGFLDTWIGITRSDDGVDYRGTDAASDETRVESDNWLSRFFGEGDESLHDALVRHGVREADARGVGALPARSAIVTVDGANQPEFAAQILAQSGGQLLTRGFRAAGSGDDPSGLDMVAGPSQAPTARTTSLYDDGVLDGGPIGDDAVAQSEGTASRPIAARPEAPFQDAAAYDDYGRFRSGTPIDESTRLQLREERLRVDKSRIARGEATVGTEIVTETHEVDVPLVREELFIERRPVRDSGDAGGSTIGTNEVVRIPLSEEQVLITKVPVVTEEVVVGKREVETMQHISETTRKEQLKTNDVEAPVSTATPLDLRP